MPDEWCVAKHRINNRAGSFNSVHADVITHQAALTFRNSFNDPTLTLGPCVQRPRIMPATDGRSPPSFPGKPGSFVGVANAIASYVAVREIIGTYATA